MNTKIVYVLTSGKDDILLEQLLLSAYSLKLHNPNCHAVIVTDKSTQDTLVGDRAKVMDYIDEVIAIQPPLEYNRKQCSRWLKTALREHITGDFLYIDSDTIITGALDDIDNCQADVAAILDHHTLLSKHDSLRVIKIWAEAIDWNITSADDHHYNGGVMYAKDTPVAHQLYKQWHENWLNATKIGMAIDQPSLAKANQQLGYVIQEIDGTWNCQIHNNGLKYFYKAKVLHYFGSNIGEAKSSCAFLFADKAIYQQIKENHCCLSEEIKANVADAKSYFTEQIDILAGAHYDCMHDVAAQFVWSQYFYHKSSYKILCKLIKAQNWLRRKLRKHSLIY